MRPAGKPLYLQIAKILKEEIENNNLPGDRLESESRIAERFRVNRHTIRHAIDELISQGYLERRRGLGVYVFSHPLKYELHSQTRITTNLRKMGVHGERSFFKRHTRPAAKETAKYMEIRKGQLIAVLESLVIVDKLPFCVSTHCFAHKGYQAIYDNFESGSLHEFIFNTFKMKLRRKSSLITGLLPTEDDAALLRIPLNQPILQAHTVNVDVETGKPVEYVISRYRGDRVDLVINF